MTSRFPPEDSRNRKKNALVRKNFSRSAISICQNQGLIPSPFFVKNTITFCITWVVFARKEGGASSERVRIKVSPNLFHPHNTSQLPVPTFSSFAAIERLVMKNN